MLNTLSSCKPSHCPQQYLCVLCLSSGGLTGVRHAMVMVNTKVLTTYGRYLVVNGYTVPFRASIVYVVAKREVMKLYTFVCLPQVASTGDC